MLDDFEPAIVTRIKHGNTKLVQFHLFCDKEFVKYVCDETRRYAHLKGFPKV